MSTTSIRIFDAGLAEKSDGKKVLNGSVDLSSLSLLKVDDYQREQLPLSSLKSILDALKNRDALPDVYLGMRGTRIVLRDGAYYLQDPVYIIDGLQRISAIKLFLDKNPGVPVRLGAAIHLDTDREWEREHFHKWNANRRRISPNKLLFNRRETSRGVEVLYSLSTRDDAFPLHEHVQWTQGKGRSDYVAAMSLARVVGALHVHKVSGMSSAIDGVICHLDKIVAQVGKQIMRDNIRTFYELIDEIWGIRRIKHQEKAPQIKMGFMFVLARFLSDYPLFWRDEEGKRLFIDATWRKAFAKFDIFEPTHLNLCSAQGKALDQLYIYLMTEMNKGKRSKRLIPRHGRFTTLAVPDEAETEEEAESMDSAEESISA